MDFALSEEQRMFRQMFADFASKEIAPQAEEMDHEETLPSGILSAAAEQGFLGATLPDEYYGADLDYVSYALLIEALARESMSVAITVATHVSMVAMTILEHGSAMQKSVWLPALAEGDPIGAFAFTEPDAGCDSAAVQAHSRTVGNEVALDGVKTCVGNGQIAALFLVFARDGNGTDAYLVPKDSPGLTVGYREPTLGLRSMSFNTLYLEDCRVPTANRLGQPGAGSSIAQGARARMSVALAAAGLGVAGASIDTAAEFAAERVQFGVPVANKQAIQTYIAEAFVDVEALRYLVHHSAWLVDQNTDYSLDASMAKAFAAQVARRVTDRMVQVMGGYGYMEDYPMARKYRDARSLGIVGGPTDLHYVAVAKRIFSDRALEVEIAP
jgi:alkylation response protein AidB-like acyl-CoA dehydrogenase